jgi:hypothetical protein
MRRDEGERARLRALVEGGEVAAVIGSRAVEASRSHVERDAA